MKIFEMADQYKHENLFWFKEEYDACGNVVDYIFVGCDALKIILDDPELADQFLEQVENEDAPISELRFLDTVGCFVSFDRCQLIEDAETDGADSWTVKQGLVVIGQ